MDVVGFTSRKTTVSRGSIDARIEYARFVCAMFLGRQCTFGRAGCGSGFAVDSQCDYRHARTSCDCVPYFEFGTLHP